MSEETAEPKAPDTSQPAETKLPLIPYPWPGAFGAYKYSKQAVAVNISLIVGLLLGNWGLSFLDTIVNNSLFTIFVYIATALLTIMTYFVFLSSARDEKTDINAVFKKTTDPATFFNLIGLYIIVIFLLLFSFLLFIVPFFIVLPRLILTPFFVIDKKLNCVDAISASWNATNGHSGKIWGIIGGAIVMFLPAITIIGLPFAIYFSIMYAAVQAVIYLYIDKYGPAKGKLPTPAVPATPAV